MMRALLSFAFAASTSLAGCALDPLVLPAGSASCPDDRRLPDGACCPAWTARAQRACEERPFVLPGPSDVWGAPSEGALQVVLDSSGAALAVHETQGGIELLQESEAHHFVSRDLEGALLGGRAPSLVAGPSGVVALAWLSGDALEVLVRAPYTDWDPLQVEHISLSPTLAAPSLAVTPEGELLLVWTASEGVLVATRSPQGTWSLPDLPGDVLSAGPASRATVSAGPSGQALIAWREGGAVIARERRAYGEPFGPAVTLSPLEGDALDEPPAVAVGPRGDVAAAFRLGKGPLFLATRPRDGAWSLPEAPFSPSNEIITAPPAVAFGPLGDLYVTWAEEGVLHAARRAANGLWIEGAGGAALPDLDHVITSAPALAVGPGGGVLIAASSSSGVVARRAAGVDSPWSPPSALSKGTGGAPAAVAIGAGDRAVIGFGAGGRTTFAFVE